MAILAEASREFFAELEEMPGLGSIVHDAREFVRFTRGKNTPWAENLSPEAWEITSRHKEDAGTFNAIVQMMRYFPFEEPKTEIPEAFLV